MLFLVVAPGVAGGVVPWLLTGWSSSGPPVWLQIVGWVALAAGIGVLLEAYGRFVVAGLGTPAPVAPPQKLVVSGLYRYVRNPIYLAFVAIVLGQAAVLGRWVLVAYAAVCLAVILAFVHWHEEPALRRRFGVNYDDYVRAVPGWWPRRPGRKA